MTIDHDDALLDALGRGEPAPDGDDLAALLGTWRSEVDESLPPLRLPVPTSPAHIDSALPHPSTDSLVPRDHALAAGQPGALGERRDNGDALPNGRPGGTGRLTENSGPGRKKRRVSRPALIGVITAVLAFGGLTAASASAEPGSPLWPITQFMFSDKASSKIAEQDAAALLAQARQALADNDSAKAAELVTAARTKIAMITDPATRERLLAEADAILAAAPDPAKSVLPTPSPLPSNGEPPITVPGTGSPTPSPTGGLLPPILPSLLPTLLPHLPLPSLPLIG